MTANSSAALWSSATFIVEARRQAKQGICFFLLHLDLEDLLCFIPIYMVSRVALAPLLASQVMICIFHQTQVKICLQKVIIGSIVSCWIRSFPFVSILIPWVILIELKEDLAVSKVIAILENEAQECLVYYPLLRCFQGDFTQALTEQSS